MARRTHVSSIAAGLALVITVFALSPFASAGKAASGPLRKHPVNPRYFADKSGKVVYLTGSHTWSNLQDMGKDDPPLQFDYDAYLDFLVEHNHNFIRLWRWEMTVCDAGSGKFRASPQPWKRAGPGNALDGDPKFDLTQFDQAYFDSLRSRVKAARDRGIYVSIMLFEGWALHASQAPWRWDGHPFNAANNINGIEGDTNNDGRGIEIQSFSVPEVTAVQEAYVRKVIDTVNDLDNVLYEIVNESGSYSTGWQYHFITFIKEYEASKPKQHPVGMTFQYSRDKEERGTNETLFASPADWISPNPDGGWRDNPPDSSGVKVVLSDTDHLWGIGGTRAWVWKSFCRGLNPLFMDRYGTPLPQPEGKTPQWVDFINPRPAADPEYDPVRDNLGYTRSYALRMNLAVTAPRPELASTGFCLAGKGVEYLVYTPEKADFTVDLSGENRTFKAEWFDPATGKKMKVKSVKGGAVVTFTPPFESDAVLYLRK